MRPDRAFFRLIHAPMPDAAPSGVRLVVDGENFRLEWDSMPEAVGSIVYIGLSPTVGPASFAQRLILAKANQVLISGLISSILIHSTKILIRLSLPDPIDFTQLLKVLSRFS